MLAVLLAWVTARGPQVVLDLGLVGAEVRPGDRTVTGLDTPLWPAFAATAVVVGALALLGVARRVLLAGGLAIVTAALLLRD